MQLRACEVQLRVLQPGARLIPVNWRGSSRGQVNFAEAPPPPEAGPEEVDSSSGGSESSLSEQSPAQGPWAAHGISPSAHSESENDSPSNLPPVLPLNVQTSRAAASAQPSGWSLPLPRHALDEPSTPPPRNPSAAVLGAADRLSRRFAERVRASPHSDDDQLTDAQPWGRISMPPSPEIEMPSPEIEMPVIPEDTPEVPSMPDTLNTLTVADDDGGAH